ncbi:zinc ribbon domain-containing protein [Haloarchaeobius amylolyticus]|uniref:zinc ribbon domain-containing protein n=1 Tax=Haloarchaeobius amylolyticus TaxID=1198296 RepID=UPI00226EAA7A|nr:zinc ribbon domain-containing protein [Haloarchaeobius amylolyticus]
MVRVRVVVAVVLSFIFPGLGHAYLRRWARSLLFVGIFVTVTAIAVPESALTSVGSIVEVTQRVSDRITLSESLAMSVVEVAAMTDAYLLASSAARTSDEGPRCPNCGKELDGDIDFCPWCAHEIDELRRVSRD